MKNKSTENAQFKAPQEGAGILIRGAARLIDIVVVAVLTALAFGAFGSLLVSVGVAPERLGNNWLLQLVGGFATLTAYTTLCEGLAGTTIGKRLFGMVVIKDDGSPCTIRAAFSRALGMLADGLFFGLVAVMIMRQSPLRKRRGDKQAGTLVVRRSHLEPDQFSPAYPLVAALPSAVGLTMLVCVIWLALDSLA
jgi:uncharacterized RDD family membrane protein YckC